MKLVVLIVGILSLFSFQLSAAYPTAFEREGRYGFTNPGSPIVAIPAQFEAVQPFEDGLAPVRLGGRWGLIDLKGRWVLWPWFEKIEAGGMGLRIARIQGWSMSGTLGSFRPDPAPPLPFLFLISVPGLLILLALIQVFASWRFLRQPLPEDGEAQRQLYWAYASGRSQRAIFFLLACMLAASFYRLELLQWVYGGLSIHFYGHPSLMKAGWYLFLTLDAFSIVLVWLVWSSVQLLTSARVERTLKGQVWPFYTYWREGIKWSLTFFFTYMALIIGAEMGSSAGMGWGGTFLGAFVALVAAHEAAPRFYPFIWRSRPLPEGPLRRQIQRLALRAGVEIQEIWVFGDGVDGQANALALAGLWTRPCIMLSSRIAAELSISQVAAVAAHELGHLQCGHSRKRIGLFVPLLAGLCYFNQVVFENFEQSSWPFWGLVLGAWFASIFAIRFLARRDEFQADLAGAALTKKPLTFMRALEKTYEKGWIPRDWSVKQRVGQTHPSLAQRKQRLALPIKRSDRSALDMASVEARVAY